MILKNFRWLAWLLVASLFFYFGIMFESREELSSSSNRFSVVAENGYIENNAIKNSERKVVYGFDSDGSVKTFGYLLYKQNYLENNSSLEIVILLHRLPKQFNIKDSRPIKYPDKLFLGYGRLSDSGDDIEIKTLPDDEKPLEISIERSEIEDTAYTSTSLNMNLLDEKVDAFFFYGRDEKKSPVMSPFLLREDPEKVWPIKFTQKNFPILWVYLT
jgi:hypothetical protein